MLKLIALGNKGQRAAGEEIGKKVVIINPIYIVGIQPWVYQHNYQQLETNREGSLIDFTEDSGYESIVVEQTVEEIWPRVK